MIDEAALRTVCLTTSLLASALGIGCVDPQTSAGAQNPSYANQPAYGQAGTAAAPQPGYVATPPGYSAQPGYAPQPGYPQAGPPQGSPFGALPGYLPQGLPTQPGLPAQPGYPTQPGYPAQPSYDPQPAPPPAQPPAPAAPPPPPGASPAPSAPGGFPFPFPFPLPGAGLPGGTTPGGGSSPSTGAATPMDPNMASVATVPLMAYAQQEAQGMQREGTVAAGTFREGQTLEQAFQMLPGKCYTVLAVGAGPTQIDLSIVAITPIPLGSGILAQTQGNGPNASLGGRGNCIKWSFPAGINAKYVIRAGRGQGIAAGQLYAK